MWALVALLLCAARAAYTPALCVNTVVGGLGGSTAPTFSNPSALALDREGAVVLTATHQVLRLDDNAASPGGQTVTTLAGSSTPGYAGDGGFAFSALLNSAAGVALAPDTTTLYIVDELNSAIRAIAADGTIRTIAGNGTAGFSGDGGAATAATFWFGPKNALFPPTPNGLLALPDGRLVVADTRNHALRSLSATGLVNTLAGRGGVAGWAGDGGPASAALLNFPTALALAPNGDIVLCDTGNNRIRRISAATGVITHVAGTGVDANGVDGALAATSPIRTYTTSVAVDPITSAIVFGEVNFKYRSISAAGVLSTIINVAGNRGTAGDGGPAVLASSDNPNGQMLFTPTGDLLFLDTSNALLRVLRRSTGRVELLLSGAGSAASSSAPPLPISAIKNLPGTSTPINNPRSMAMASDGAVIIADYGAQAILALAPNGSVNLVAGNGKPCPSGPLAPCGVPGPAAGVAIKPYALAVGPGQEVYAGLDRRYIVRIDRATGSVVYLAGTGGEVTTPASGLYGPAATTALNPTAMALDAAGNLWFTEPATYRIRVLGLTGAQSGAVYTVVDSSASLGGYTLTSCAALNCSVGQGFVGMAFLPDGSLIFPDNNQFSVLYRLNPAGTLVTRFAGLPWSGASGLPPVGPAPHNVSALTVYLNQPYGIAVDSATLDVFFAGFDRRVFQVDDAGTIWTLAGSGGALSTGDGGAPLDAGFQAMRGLVLDPTTGNLFVVELGRIREVVRGPTPTCPVGYSCPCGLRPVPCTDPAAVCKGGVAAPALVPPSMYALGMPAVPPPQIGVGGGALTYYDVAPCPPGSYCLGGESRLCPPGTYGRSPRQSTLSSCQACPINTYSAQPRTPCYPCEPGFYASSPASSFCTACPPGTSTSGTLSAAAGTGNSSSSGSSSSSPGATLLSPSALFCFPCASGTVSGYGAAACTPMQSQASSTDTKTLLSPTFAFQRSLTFNIGNADPAALQALYTVTAAPIVGGFGIPLGVLGLLYGLVWALGSWEEFWAPLPTGVMPRTWKQYFQALIPPLPTLEECRRWLISLVPSGVYMLLGLTPPKPAEKAKEAGKEAGKGPTPATLQMDIDSTIDALLAAPCEDPSRPALLAKLREQRAALKEAEAPKKEEKKAEPKVEDKREGPREPAATWVGRRRQAWEDTSASYASMLEKMDIYCAIKNEIQKGLKVQVSKPTSLGGGISILFIGVLLAVCAILIEQFILSNAAAATGSIKLTAWEIGALARYPPYVQAFPDLAAPAAPLLPGPGLESGMQVTIRTHGPRCAAPLKVVGLMAVSNFTSRAPLVNNATGRVTHVYDCVACVADSLSKLTLTFDASCASFDITAAAVGAWGTFSMLQVTAPNVSGLTASFSVLPQQVLDFIGGTDPTASGFPTGGRSARGAFINSGALLSTLPYNASAVAAGAAPPTVLTLLLPSTDLFTRVTLDVRLTILQLINGLLGNLGVLGGAAVMYAILAKLYDACKAGAYAGVMAALGEVQKHLGCAPLPAELQAAAAGARKVGDRAGEMGQGLQSMGVKDGKGGVGGAALAAAGVAGPGALALARNSGSGAGDKSSGSGSGPLSSASPKGQDKAPAPTTLWVRDTDGQEEWFVNVDTGESVWDLPAGGVLQSPQGAANPLYRGEAVPSGSSKQVRVPAPVSPPSASLWRKCTSGDEKDWWFVNDETGESVWDLPPGGILMNDKAR